MLLLRYIFKFFDLLRRENAPWQIACAIVLGMFIGFTPYFTLQTVTYIVILLIFRIHIGFTLISFLFFHALSVLTDPLFHQLGLSLLTETPGMQKLWAGLYHSPIVPFTGFNNSLVLGGGVVSSVLALPLFFISRLCVIQYGHAIARALINTTPWRMWAGTTLYRTYVRYQQSPK